MKYLIINADDLGICESTNSAIAEAHCRGVVTSASLMANGPAFRHAVSNVVRQNPNLGVGLHVCLVGAKSLVAPEKIPLLVNERGEFRQGFVSLLKLTHTKRRVVVEQIEREIAAQFETMEAHGVAIDHVDSHRHYHMIPTVFEVVTRLARRHGCPTVRISHEPLRTIRPSLWLLGHPLSLGNLPKKMILSEYARVNRRYLNGLTAADRVFGILQSGNMDASSLLRAVEHPGDGVVEVIMHPGRASPIIGGFVSRSDRRFLHCPHREAERQALIDGRVRAAIEEENCVLVRFADVGAARQRAGQACIVR